MGAGAVLLLLCQYCNGLDCLESYEACVRAFVRLCVSFQKKTGEILGLK